MSDQKPSVGRIVHYKLSSTDCAMIDHVTPQYDESRPAGHKQARNAVSEGQVYPALVAAIFGNGEHINMMVQLDGYAQYWATSRAEGDEPGRWSWPPRA